MTLACFGAATAAFLAACLLYYRGRFFLALGCAYLYFGLMGTVAFAELGRLARDVAVGALVVVPVAYLTVHVADQRYGLFLLPTVYSIVAAFVAGVALWLLCGAALLW
ncbi:MAG: hypothetical protein ACREID_10365 [Planctomycetota bacterium]